MTLQKCAQQRQKKEQNYFKKDTKSFVLVSVRKGKMKHIRNQEGGLCLNGVLGSSLFQYSVCQPAHGGECRTETTEYLWLEFAGARAVFQKCHERCKIKRLLRFGAKKKIKKNNTRPQSLLPAPIRPPQFFIFFFTQTESLILEFGPYFDAAFNIESGAIVFGQLK